MERSADIVVVGAGHNSLTTAAYLAAAGLRVVVLERNGFIGGGCVTREVTLPGFKHDLHSTGHIMIQANPMIAKDELMLKSRFGLEYVTAPAFFSSVFPDGSCIQSFGSLDDTCTSIAKFSSRDAQTYRAFVAQSNRLLPMFQMGLFNPPTHFGAFMAMLDQSPDGKTMIGDMLRSVYDIVSEMFENERVQMHFMRWASEGMNGPECKGTGSILYLMCSFLHKYHCQFPKGGSVGLSLALQRCIEHHGGQVLTSSPVKRLVRSGGRATGVELADGSTITARKAVLGSIHPYLLNDFVDGTLDAGLQAQLKRVKVSEYAAMNTHYALNAAPRYKVEGGKDFDRSFCVETQPETLEEFRINFDQLRRQQIPDHVSVCSICTSSHDPSRAPEGKQTLYLYAFMPYRINNRSAEPWDRVKDEVADRMLESLRSVTTNMGPENILARHVESPLDMERCSPSFQQGDICGAGMYMYQYMGRRPVPALADYTVPGIPGFYLVGPFMHPGGGVIGGGRPVALKMMRDLGMNTDKLSAI